MDFLNSKQRKLFFRQLAEQYGYDGTTEYALYYGGQNKIYIVSHDLDLIPFEDLKPRMAGMYVAESVRKEIRLTMDGAMLFGPSCHDCFVDVDQAGRDAWMRGEDLAYDISEARYVLVRWNNKILGCGHAANGSIKGFVPKGRRIHDPHAA